jgi:hypothetical protein
MKNRSLLTTIISNEPLVCDMDFTFQKKYWYDICKIYHEPE